VICDEVRAAPGDVTIVATGPLTNMPRHCQQQPDLASLIGSFDHDGRHVRWPGNVTAAAESISIAMQTLLGPCSTRRSPRRCSRSI